MAPGGLFAELPAPTAGDPACRTHQTLPSRSGPAWPADMGQTVSCSPAPGTYLESIEMLGSYRGC